MANITYETTAMIWKLKGTIKVENWKRKKDYNNNNMTITGLRDATRRLKRIVLLPWLFTIT